MFHFQRLPPFRLRCGGVLAVLSFTTDKNTQIKVPLLNARRVWAGVYAIKSFFVTNARLPEGVVGLRENCAGERFAFSLCI
jgi:hypothetical protein